MRKPLIIIGLLVLIGIVAGLGFILNSPEDTVLRSMSIGVLSSLVSALIFATMIYFLVNEPMTDRAKLKDLLEELQKRELQGVDTIREKYEFIPEYWISLVRESQCELDLLGHSLAKWCEQPYADPFAEQLITIARKGGKVRIVILHPDGKSHDRIQQSLKKSYSQEIRSFVTFLNRKVLDTLPVKKRDCVTIKWCEDIDFPYMFIRTDQHVVVSPYLAMTDSEHNLLMAFHRDSQFANTFRNDFERIFAASVGLSLEEDKGNG